MRRQTESSKEANLQDIPAFERGFNAGYARAMYDVENWPDKQLSDGEPERKANLDVVELANHPRTIRNTGF
jgi:hypothetical protein